MNGGTLGKFRGTVFSNGGAIFSNGASIFSEFASILGCIRCMGCKHLFHVAKLADGSRVCNIFVDGRWLICVNMLIPVVQREGKICIFAIGTRAS